MVKRNLYPIGASAAEQADEVPRDWYFTFGVGDPVHAGHYVVIHGTYLEAREEMVQRHGWRWAFQYESAQAAGVDRWHLRRVEGEP